MGVKNNQTEKLTFMNATENDKAEIMDLYRSLVGTEFCAWNENYPGEQDMAGDLSRDGLFCLKDGNSRIVGVISIDQDEAVENLTVWTKELQPSSELSRLGVHVDHQNQGIARLLLQNGMTELKRRGRKSVHFLVCKTNEKAIRSYNQLNFDVVGECELFNEHWWCYEKAL